MRVGEWAEVTRTFSAADLAAWVELGGDAWDREQVPEPLIGALFSYLLGMELPGLGTNYLKQDTAFLAEVTAGEPLTARVEITRLRPAKHLVDLATTCRKADGTPVARGRALVYVRDAGKLGAAHN